MKYTATSAFLHPLFEDSLSRRTIVDALFDDSDIAAIASEHGVEQSALVAAWTGIETSDVGARLRLAVERMRGIAGAPHGAAFPDDLSRATDGGLELAGLYANPLATTALLLGRPLPPFDETARAIDPALSLAAYASRVFRLFAVQLPSLAAALGNAAAALERA